MRRKIWASFIHRGGLSFFAFGIGLIAGGSLMPITYVIGGIAILIGICIFIYNWRHPTEDEIPSIPDAIKYSKLVWGFWHTGERAKYSFKYGSVKRVLLLEPNRQNKSFLHILEQAPVTPNELAENIHLTTQRAIDNKIPVKWHNDPTVLSFTICDPSPTIEQDIVIFSNKAYVVVQVIDKNLDREEWSLYKKTMSKDKYAFNAYAKWFKDVWDNRSKEGLLRNETTKNE